MKPWNFNYSTNIDWSGVTFFTLTSTAKILQILIHIQSEMSYLITLLLYQTSTRDKKGHKSYYIF